MSHSKQNRTFWRRFPGSKSLDLVWKKLYPTPQKHAFTNQKKYYNTKKQKPGLANFYDTWLGNAAGLFSKEKIREEISKEKVKKTG